MIVVRVSVFGPVILTYYSTSTNISCLSKIHSTQIQALAYRAYSGATCDATYSIIIYVNIT